MEVREVKVLERLRNLRTPRQRAFSDEYGLVKPPPPPLAFDRVNQNKPFAQATLLFTFPLEILVMMIEVLPNESLASIALVSRDARQLARSRQFARIQLNYSLHSIALVNKLMREADIRGSRGDSNISQSLGACIRSITVATCPREVFARHSIPLKLGCIDMWAQTLKKSLADADRFFFRTYIPNIQSLLTSRVVLPHLETLDWRDSTILPPLFFNQSSFIHIQHLRLYRVKIGEALGMSLSTQWPLRTLELNILSDPGAGSPSTTLACASILSVCASTMKSLKWTSNDDRHSFTPDMMRLVPQFSELKCLSLCHVRFSDSSMLDAFLKMKLRELQGDLGQDAINSRFFQKRGGIPTLTTLKWNGKIAADEPLSFLKENTQLSKLSILAPAPRAFLELKLLPLLTKSFRQLTSLSLDWVNSSIPSSALKMIGSLTSLIQLRLAAGGFNLGRNAWVIDHELLISRLKNLTSLTRLVFSRDVYDNGPELGPPDRYYMDNSIFQGPANVVPHDWETKHADGESAHK